MKGWAAAGLLALILAQAGAALAQPPCRQALALALDVSGSVDAREYRLQLEGVAKALENAQVRDALLSMPDAPIMLTIFEWSGPADQAELLPWTRIDTRRTLDNVIETLRQTERRDATPGTALGVAMQRGAALLAEQSHCWRRTLDISGDGPSNLGPRPRDVKKLLRQQGGRAGALTINGLVIGADDAPIGDTRQAEIGGLSSYYHAEVILGPDAFVQTALGYEDYARAMAEKLLRELDMLIVSQRLTPEGRR